MFHRSERLFLRPAFPEDSGAILAGINDEAVVRNLARAPWPYRMEDAQFFAALPQDPRLPHFLVTLPGVGVIGSAGMGEHEGQAEIGYWIARAHWGRGYATEAAGAVLRIARTLGHLGCEIEIEPGRLISGNSGVLVSGVIYVKNGATVGIGAGQMSRVDSARIAARKAQDAAETPRLRRLGPAGCGRRGRCLYRPQRAGRRAL